MLSAPTSSKPAPSPTLVLSTATSTNNAAAPRLIIRHRNSMSVVEAIHRDGFEVMPDAIGNSERRHLIDLMDRLGVAAGRRIVLADVEELRALAHSEKLQSLVNSILGENSSVVRGLFFNKTPDANWM